MPFSKQQTTYQSEITHFIDDLKKANPKLEQQQFASRALLWDKAPINLGEWKRNNESSLPFDSMTYPT